MASAAELRRVKIRCPCAVKSDSPVGSLAGTRIVRRPEELLAVLAGLPPEERLVVQSRLEGPLVCLAIVLDRAGTAVSSFQHVATHTWPMEAGPTARGISVAPDRALIRRATEILSLAGYWGLAQLDFMQGPQGLTLLDVNPRFYPALALATACGVNLPAAWHAVVADEPVPTPQPYRVGARYRWLEADLLAALRGHPGRLLARPASRTTGAMWDAADPLPAALLAAEALLSRRARLAAALTRPRSRPQPAEPVAHAAASPPVPSPPLAERGVRDAAAVP